MIDPDLIHPLEYWIRHCDEQKTDHKSIAIRQLIREMKSMPDEIQLIDVEAEDQEQTDESAAENEDQTEDISKLDFSDDLLDSDENNLNSDIS